MRPYQDLLRSEIRDRVEAIRAEIEANEAASDAVPDDRDSGHVRLQLQLAERFAALAKEGSDLEWELSVRDKSAGEAAMFGGPGRD